MSCWSVNGILTRWRGTLSNRETVITKHNI